MIAFVLDFFDRRPGLVGYAAGLAVIVVWAVVGAVEVAP